MMNARGIAIFMLWAYFCQFSAIPAVFGAEIDVSEIGKVGWQKTLPKFPVQIPRGAIVEGSSRFGGVQPDYVIDIEDEAFEPLMEFSESVGQTNLSFWEKIEQITTYIRQNVLPGRKYDQKEYIGSLVKYSAREMKIPLSEYIKIKAGVCRENAMILHFALLRAGIQNQFAYARVYVKTSNYENTEDHAFTVVEHQGRKWVVDSYDAWFNGFALDDLMSKEGVSPHSKGSPNALELDAQRKILQFNNYPRIYQQEANDNFYKIPTTNSCRRALGVI